jgi:NADH-quinone oxidoreductase subunit I
MGKSTIPRKTHRVYWNEPEMGAWDRFYLFEIVRGLAITGGVFLRNMWKWCTGRKGAVTAYYPEEMRPDYAAGNRGKHVLTQRPDGRPQCVACNMCATVCPAQVIEIDAAFDPEDAIRMVKDVPNLPGADRGAMWLKKEELLTWQPHGDVAKPYPVAGKAAGARS